MTTATVPTEAMGIEEPFEAVAITGPHRGKIVKVAPGAVLNGDANGESEPQLTPEEEAALNALTETAQQIAERVERLELALERLLRNLREAKQKRRALA